MLSILGGLQVGLDAELNYEDNEYLSGRMSVDELMERKFWRGLEAS